MIYDTSIPEKIQEAADMLAEFGARGKTIELKVYQPQRTMPQHRGLWVLLTHLAQETGYTKDECYQMYRNWNKSMFTYFKQTRDGDDVIVFEKHLKDLNKEEFSRSIETLYQVCADNGITLPILRDEADEISLQNEQERNGYYP